MFPSPFTVGERVAAYAHEKDYDVILCGVMSEDLMQGLVGPIIAGLLKWPCLTSVHTVDYQEASGALRCEREVEGGKQEMLDVGLPALLTIQSGIHVPRYPALSKLLRANKYPLENFAAEPQANTARRQQIIGIRLPERMRAGVMIEGSGEDKARQLAALLQAKGLC
jgi:electron transfer flavoprotein beta subunit